MELSDFLRFRESTRRQTVRRLHYLNQKMLKRCSNDRLYRVMEKYLCGHFYPCNARNIFTFLRRPNKCRVWNCLPVRIRNMSGHTSGWIVSCLRKGKFLELCKHSSAAGSRYGARGVSVTRANYLQSLVWKQQIFMKHFDLRAVFITR